MVTKDLAGNFNSPISTSYPTVQNEYQHEFNANYGGGGTYAGVDISYATFLSDLSWAAAGEQSHLSTLGAYTLINLQTTGGAAAQDQFIAPLASLGVPEPASIVVWSMLAGSAARFGVARKRRKQAPAGRWSEDNRQAIFAMIERGPNSN